MNTRKYVLKLTAEERTWLTHDTRRNMLLNFLCAEIGKLADCSACSRSNTAQVDLVEDRHRILPSGNPENRRHPIRTGSTAGLAPEGAASVL